MRIQLVGYDCPTLPGVTVGVQRGAQVVDPHPAAGGDLTWLIEARVVEGPHLRGPFVHGRPGGRFLYLSWQHESTMFRRAKLMLDALPPDLLTDAGGAGLRARFRLTMPDGSPLCAAVRPPEIVWSAAPVDQPLPPEI
jgi:hypothetical protein